MAEPGMDGEEIECGIRGEDARVEVGEDEMVPTDADLTSSLSPAVLSDDGK